MNKLSFCILVLCSVGISSVAKADENSGMYIYGAVGQSQNANPTSESQDSYMGFLGYQMNSKWSIEGGYVDLGKTSYSGTVTSGGVTGTLNLTTKSKATTLAAVRTWVVPDYFGNNSFSFLAKFGIAQVKSTVDGTVSITIPTLLTASGSGSVSYTKKGVTFGLGAKYDFDQNWSLRMEADSFDTGQYAYGRIPVYSAGLSYIF
jgi:OOP family OmpA-OmpF porin